MRVLIAITALLGCGGKSSTVNGLSVTTPATAPAEAACPTTATFALADGQFRCRELPFEIEFPKGATIERLDKDWVTRFSASLDGGGLLAVILMPRISLVGATLDEMVPMIARAMIANADPTRADDVAVHGVTGSARYTLVTGDGGVGEIRGYFAGSWFVAIMSAAPVPGAGGAFFASFRTRAVSDGFARVELASGAHLDVPTSAWWYPQNPVTPATKQLLGYRLAEGTLGIREFADAAICARIATARDDELLALFSETPLDVKRLVHVGKTVELDVVQMGMNEAAYVICDGKSLVQIALFGTAPNAELRAIVGHVAKTFVGAP